MNNERIAFIGAGNVSWHLALAFARAGMKVTRVWSRTPSHADRIASLVGATPADNLNRLADEADIFILAVSDDAIPLLANRLHLGDKLLVHTAGSVSIRTLAPASSRYGVLWPVQSLLQGVPVAYDEIPFAIEASSVDARDALFSLAGHVSRHLYDLSENQRRTAHLCAAVVSNFGNAINAVAQNLMSDGGCDFNLLRPLIAATAQKALSDNLWQQQTGPARRHDQTTLLRHRELLSDDDIRQLYDLMTRIIQKHTSSTP